MNIVDSWYLSHLRISWKEATEDEMEKAKKLKDKTYDPNKWFKERIIKTRWVIFIVPDLCPSPERQTELLKEYYKQRK